MQKPTKTGRHKSAIKTLNLQISHLLKSYENIKIANNSLKGRWSWPSEANWWSHDAMLRKSEKNMVISVHTLFVKYINNLYTLKILSLKTTTTQYLSTFTNTRKIIINKHICKAHTDHSKAKSAISKIFRSTHLPKIVWTCQSTKQSQRQLVRGSRHNLNPGLKIGSKMTKIGQNGQFRKV